MAHRWARLHVPDERRERDALFAAIALVHGMTVVKRNAADVKRHWRCSRQSVGGPAVTRDKQQTV